MGEKPLGIGGAEAAGELAGSELPMTLGPADVNISGAAEIAIQRRPREDDDPEQSARRRRQGQPPPEEDPGRGGAPRRF